MRSSGLIELAGVCLFLFIGSTRAAINIQGTVTDSSTGNGIQGAIVILVNAGLRDTTTGTGAFQLTGGVSTITSPRETKSGFIMRPGAGNSLYLHNDRTQHLRVRVMTVQGVTVARLHDDMVAAGDYNLRAPGLAPGYYISLAETPYERQCVSFLIDSKGTQSRTFAADRRGSTASLGKLFAAAAFTDTISVSRSGFFPKRVVVTDSAAANLEIQLCQFSTLAGMRKIPPGSFQMGSSAIDDEQPVHTVTITQFWMDTTEVTQADYVALMTVNPSGFTGDTMLPVEQTSWFDAVLYCNRRSRRDGMDTVYSYTSFSGTAGSGCTGLSGLAIDTSKQGYRLPTEAEWECACRAGTATVYFWGGVSVGSQASQYAWYYSNGNDATHPVATKLPNAWGLYDMTGNVWEWCNDWYDSTYVAGPQTDPQGPDSGTCRVSRGGAWDYVLGYRGDALDDLRSAKRNSNLPASRDASSGFRCVRR